MGISVGEIGLDLVVNKNGFNKQIQGIQNTAKKAAGMLAGALAIKGGLDLTKQCLDLGSDLAEVQNVVDVTFPHMTEQIDAFAKNAAQQFGLSETMAKKFSGMYGSMAEAFGYSEKAAATMATTLTGLAGDVASFYNIDQEEAYTKLKAVFSGETEVLKDLGIVMTQTALDSYAMANGFGKTVQKMSEAEKVALRYAFVQDQLTNATGDFARTSDSWANQVRILSLQFDSLKATIGQGLINVFAPILTVVNALIKKLISFASVFKAFTELITGKKNQDNGVAQVAAAAGKATKEVKKTTGATKSLTKATKKAGEAAKKAAKNMLGLASFDELNNFSSSKTKAKSSNDDKGTSTTVPSIPSSGLDMGGVSTDAESANKALGKLESVIQKIKTALQPTINAFKNLWEALKPLKTFAAKALVDFYNNFLVPVGKWVLGKGLPGFVNALANGIAKIDFPKINKALANFWSALAPFAINIGEGLLWFWKNVLVPLGTWTANEVVPRFLNTLSLAIKAVNACIEALKPLAQWLWTNVLEKFAKWTGNAFLKLWDGINKALGMFGTWCSNNKAAVQGIVVTLGTFFAAWKTVELMSFIQQSGGVVLALKSMATALLGTTVAKAKDLVETAALNAMYAKDFVVNLARSTAGLIKHAAKLAVSTAAKIAETAAQIAMTAATAAWNAVCAVGTALTTAFGAAVAFLTSPIGIAIVAITALVAAGVAIYKNWDKIKAKASELWKAITNTFKGVGEWFKAQFQKAYKSMTEKFTLAAIFFLGVWTAIKNVFAAVKEFFKEKFVAAYDNVKSAFSAAGTFFKEIWTNIKNVFAAVGTWFKEKFVAAYNNVKNAFSAAETFFSGVWSNIKNAFPSVATWFKDKFTSAYSKVKSAFSGVASFFSGVWKSIKSPFSSVADWFKDKFSAAWEKVKNVFSTGGKIFDGIKDGIASTFKTIVNGIIKGINKVIKVPFDAINGMLNTIRGVGVGGVKPFKGLWDKDPIKIPQIPQLANGGFVKANTPQLAMIGDNRHQGEVVSPEDKLQKMADEAAARAGANTANALIPVIERLCNAIIDLENGSDGHMARLEGVSSSGLYKLIKEESEKERKRGVRFGI